MTIPWTHVEYDTDGFWEGVTNPSRVTIPAGKGGYYLMQTQVGWAANSTGNRYSVVFKNGAYMVPYVLVSGRAPTTPRSALFFATAVVLLAAGDYLQVKTWQDSGGDINLNADQCAFTFARLG